jgi:hypothetical protein
MFFIAISFVIFYNFVTPAMYDLKERNEEFQKSIKHMMIQKRNLEDYTFEFEQTKSNNSLIYKSLFLKYSKEDIEKIIKKNLSKVSVVRSMSSKKSQNNFRYQSYVVRSQIKNPMEFFKFIDRMESQNIAIKIDFPIKFKTKQNKIDVSFELKVYSIIK